MRDYVVVFVTASSEDEAAKMAKVLVEETLAGCVNIVRGVRSIYSWQGKIEDESEALLVIKTRQELYGALEEKVREMHSYEVPEVIAFPIVEGSKGYLDWLWDVTAKKKKRA